MTCQEVEARLLAWYAEELDPATIRAFVKHLRQCDCCTSLVGSYGGVVELGKLGKEELPVEVGEKLRDWLAAKTQRG
jgi:hypothetical protein